jgi:hypothetical protein
LQEYGGANRGGGGTRSLPGLIGLPLLFRAWGAHSLPGDALPKHNQGFSELRLRAPNRDVALVRRATLEDKGGHLGARNVCDLFKAATLMPDDMTRERIRNCAGHLVSVGLTPSRENLGEVEGEGDASSNGGNASGGLWAFARLLRACGRSSRGGVAALATRGEHSMEATRLDSEVTRALRAPI